MKRLACAGAALLVAGAACGVSEGEPPSSSGAGAGRSGIDAADGTGARLDGGGNPERPVQADGGSAGAAEPEPFEVVDVPDAPCTPTTAALITILLPEPLKITFDHAGSVAERRFAFDSGTLAFVTFPSDAASAADASPPVYGDLLALSGNGTGLRALELDASGALVATAFDAWGVRLATSINVDEAGTGNHALLSAGERSLAVWRTGRELRSRVLGATAVQGQIFDFGPASCGEHDCNPIVLGSEGHFVLVWGRTAHDAGFSVSFAAIGTGGATLSIKTVLSSREEYRLVDAALLADQSIALLLSEGAPSRAAVLQMLDRFGNLAGPARRLLGAAEPWSVASHGSSLGVVARSLEDQAVFRSFSALGQPSGAWSCIDDSEPGSGFAPRAAIFAEPGGYGMVVRRIDGSASYGSVDELGAARTP